MFDQIAYWKCRTTDSNLTPSPSSRLIGPSTRYPPGAGTQPTAPSPNITLRADSDELLGNHQQAQYGSSAGILNHGVHNLSLAPGLVAVEQRSKVRLRDYFIIGQSQFQVDDQALGILTLESVLEASAESSPLVVVVAVLPLRLRSRQRRRVLVVPLAPVVGCLNIISGKFTTLICKMYLQDR